MGPQLQVFTITCIAVICLLWWHKVKLMLDIRYSIISKGSWFIIYTWSINTTIFSSRHPNLCFHQKFTSEYNIPYNIPISSIPCHGGDTTNLIIWKITSMQRDSRQWNASLVQMVYCTCSSPLWLHHWLQDKTNETLGFYHWCIYTQDGNK